MITDFVFDKVKLSDLGYVAFWQNSEDQVTVSDMNLNTIKAARSDISHSTSYTYENNYSSTFLLLKDSCRHNPDELNLTYRDISELTKWLCRKQYKWFRLIKDDDDDEIWYQVQIDVKKELAGEDVIGLTITVNANTPYGFSKQKVKSFTNSPYMVRTHSDEEGYIYPDVEITLRQSGNLVLTNTLENRQTTIKNCINTEKITIYGGDLQQIISTNQNHDFVTEFNYVFPRLLCNYYEFDNNFTSNLACDISFTYRDIRKVGMS